MPDAAGPAPDVVVVGAGIVGCATAAFLAAAGLRVTIVEQAGLASGASGANSGVVQHPFDAALAGLYAVTIDLYRELSALNAGFRLPAAPAGLCPPCPEVPDDEPPFPELPEAPAPPCPAPPCPAAPEVPAWPMGAVAGSSLPQAVRARSRAAARRVGVRMAGIVPWPGAGQMFSRRPAATDRREAEDLFTSGRAHRY